MFASIADNAKQGIFLDGQVLWTVLCLLCISKSAREELEAKIYRRRIYAVQRILKPKSML
jgi:hypothetical protein